MQTAIALPAADPVAKSPAPGNRNGDPRFHHLRCDLKVVIVGGWYREDALVRALDTILDNVRSQSRLPERQVGGVLAYLDGAYDALWEDPPEGIGWADINCGMGAASELLSHWARPDPLRDRARPSEVHRLIARAGILRDLARVAARRSELAAEDRRSAKRRSEVIRGLLRQAPPETGSISE